MVRLPIPGNDIGTWGAILNEYLQVELNSDGTLKKAAAISHAQTDATTAISKADDAQNTADAAQNTANAAIPSSWLDTDNTLAASSNSKVATQRATKLYVDTQVASGVPDATTSAKGKIRLNGDLAGTANVPTVPALADKLSKSSGGHVTNLLWTDSIRIGSSATINHVLMTDAQGNGTWKPVPTAPVLSVNGKTDTVVINAGDVGLGNANNTSDADKPISTDTQTALNLKENKVNKGVANGYASLDNTGVIPVAQLPNQSGSYIPITAKGVASGVATLDSNTLLPTAQLPNIPYANLPVGTGSTKVAAGNDSRITGAIQSTALDTDGTLASNSDTKIASQKATKAYADSIALNTRTASYTLVLSDTGKIIEMNVASANTLTVPPNSSVAFPIGTIIEVSQLGAGVTTITAGAGVTINSLGSKIATAGQYAGVSLRKRATDTWQLVGALA